MSGVLRAAQTLPKLLRIGLAAAFMSFLFKNSAKKLDYFPIETTLSASLTKPTEPRLALAPNCE